MCENLGRFTVRYKVFLLLVGGETQSTVSVDTRDGLPSLTWRPTYWVRTPIVNALGPRRGLGIFFYYVFLSLSLSSSAFDRHLPVYSSFSSMQHI